MKIAFDIDDTLLLHNVEAHNGVFVPTGETIPNYELIQVLKWFRKNGNDIYFWSAGGQDYCETMVKRLGLQNDGKVIEKKMNSGIDICFDDQEVMLAEVNIQVK